MQQQNNNLLNKAKGNTTTKHKPNLKMCHVFVIRDQAVLHNLSGIIWKPTSIYNYLASSKLLFEILPLFEIWTQVSF